VGNRNVNEHGIKAGDKVKLKVREIMTQNGDVTV
jgi:translation initiation factor IF-1